MQNDSIEILLNGRKARGQKLTWRETKEQLARLANKAPEVVVNVRGGGTTSSSSKRYMGYISRDGRLDGHDDQGQVISGKDDVANLHDAWDLDMQKGRGRLHQTMNVVLSMPADTDPKKVLAAAKAFARANISRHQYLMVLHTHDTDPEKPAPKHPHVHLIIRAEDCDGQRLYIRKATLRAWRESFAAKLREQGIEANATSRDLRGVNIKNKKPGEYRAGMRGAATAPAKRFAEAGQELEHGNTKPKPWEKAMAARRRDVVRGLAQAAIKLRQEGDISSAQAVERHAANLPALDTERRQMQRAIVNQVEIRLREQEQEQHKEL